MDGRDRGGHRAVPPEDAENCDRHRCVASYEHAYGQPLVAERREARGDALRRVAKLRVRQCGSALVGGRQRIWRASSLLLEHIGQRPPTSLSRRPCHPLDELCVLAGRQDAEDASDGSVDRGGDDRVNGSSQPRDGELRVLVAQRGAVVEKDELAGIELRDEAEWVVIRGDGADCADGCTVGLGERQLRGGVRDENALEQRRAGSEAGRRADVRERCPCVVDRIRQHVPQSGEPRRERLITVERMSERHGRDAGAYETVYAVDDRRTEGDVDARGRLAACAVRLEQREPCPEDDRRRCDAQPSCAVEECLDRLGFKLDDDAPPPRRAGDAAAVGRPSANGWGEYPSSTPDQKARSVVLARIHSTYSPKSAAGVGSRWSAKHSRNSNARLHPSISR